jgi:hypothetical protein
MRDSAKFPFLSGRPAGATTSTVMRSIWDTRLAGTGPDDQFHGVALPVR